MNDEAPLVELVVVLFFLVDILSFLHEPNTNGGRQLLWGSELTFTNNERKLKAQEPKPKLKHKKKKTKSSFSTVNFSKVDLLYKCQSVSLYREASRLFTYRDYPHVKWIKTECARIILGSLQLGLHVIGSP
jgi:hypothetical protein